MRCQQEQTLTIGKQRFLTSVSIQQWWIFFSVLFVKLKVEWFLKQLKYYQHFYSGGVASQKDSLNDVVQAFTVKGLNFGQFTVNGQLPSIVIEFKKIMFNFFTTNG